MKLALLITGAATVAGGLLAGLWLMVFFGLSNNDTHRTWTLARCLGLVWTILLIGGAMALLSVVVLMLGEVLIRSVQSILRSH